MPTLRRTIIAPAVSRRRANSVSFDAVHADFAAFLGSSGEPPITFTARADGRIDGFNERWFGFTGLKRSTTEAFRWQCALHPDDILGFLEHWSRAVRTSDPFQLDCRLRHRDGDFRWFHCRALPYYDEKCVIAHWLGACTELTGKPKIRIPVTDDIVRAPAAGTELEPVIHQVQHDLAMIEQTLTAGDSDLIARIAHGLQGAAESCVTEFRREVDACLNPDRAANSPDSAQPNP